MPQSFGNINLGLTTGHLFAGVKWAFTLVGGGITLASPFVWGWVETTVHTTTPDYSATISKAQDAYVKGVTNDSNLQTAEHNLWRAIVEDEGALYCYKSGPQERASCATRAGNDYDFALSQDKATPRSAAAAVIHMLRPKLPQAPDNGP